MLTHLLKTHFSNNVVPTALAILPHGFDWVRLVSVYISQKAVWDVFFSMNELFGKYAYHHPAEITHNSSGTCASKGLLLWDEGWPGAASSGLMGAVDRSSRKKRLAHSHLPYTGLE